MNREQFDSEVLAGHYSSPVRMERAKGYELGEHSHEFDALALILEGSITLTVAGEEHSYCAGEVFRLPAGTVHLERAGEQGVSYLSARREVAARPTHSLADKL